MQLFLACVSVVADDAPNLSPRLDLWPGFITSILQYEDSIMLCADVSHKIMRSDTVYDTLEELYQTSRNFHEDAVKTLVGEIVLTRSGVVGGCTLVISC